MALNALLLVLGLVSSGPDSAGSVVAPREPTTEERPAISAGCRDSLDREWAALVASRDDATSVARLETMERACAADREARGLLYAFHAELDLRAGRYAEGVRRMETSGLREDDIVWPTSRWTYLALTEMTGDAVRFRQVRDELLAVHDRALQSHPRHHMRKVEHFETAYAAVDAYEGEAKQGLFARSIVFVASPRNGGMPVTLTVTRSLGVESILGGKPAYFFDLYPCDGHATLAGGGSRQPTYRDARRRAAEVFGDAETFPAFQQRAEMRFCAFESYMLPGFDPEEEDRR